MSFPEERSSSQKPGEGPVVSGLGRGTQDCRRDAKEGPAAAVYTWCPADDAAGPGGREGGAQDRGVWTRQGLAPDQGALVPGFSAVQWDQVAPVLASLGPTD